MATRKFYDGFESYTADADIPSTNWDDRPPNPVGTVRTTGGAGPKAGSQMARLNHPDNNILNNERNSKNFSSLYTNECFIRVWFMFDNNFDFGTGSSGIHMLRWFTDSNNDMLVAQPSPPSTSFQQDAIINGSRPSGSPKNYGYVLTKNVWHKFEMYIKLSATTAVKSWDDDTLQLNISGFDWGGWKPSVFNLTGNHPAAPTDDNYIYFDEVEFFSDATDGEATTGSMDNASIEVAAGGSSDSTPKRGALSLSPNRRPGRRF